MKTKVSYMLALVVMLLVVVMPAFAQPVPPAIPDVYGGVTSLGSNKLANQVDQKRRAMFHSLGRKKGGEGGDRMYDFSSDAIFMNKGANSWCPTTNPNCAGSESEGDPSEIAISQGAREIGWATGFDSTGGLLDVMKAPMYYAMVMTNAMSSNMAVLNTAWMLTEPAVAGALSNSLGVANGMLEGQYQADAAYMRHLQGNPKTAFIATDIYQACIYGKISATPPTPPKSWLQASAECRGGSRSDAMPGITATYTGVPGPLTDLIPDLRSNPDHLLNPRNAIMSGRLSTDRPFGMPAGPTYVSLTDVNLPRQISIWDFVFNPAQRDIIYVSTPVNANDAIHFVKLREAITDMAGDVYFRLGGVNLTSPGTADVIAAKFGSRKIEIKTEQGNPGRYYRDLVKANYNSITNLMYLRCWYQEVEKKGVVPPWSNFWLNARQTAERFSVVGLQEHPGQLEAIYQGWYQWAKSRHRAIGGTGLGCDDLLASGVPDVAAAWKDGDFDKILTTGNLNDKPEYVRLFFTIARRAAYAKVLHMFMEAEGTVLALSGGPFDDLVRQYGLDRIYQSAGTSNLREAFNINLAQFNEFLSAYYQDLESKVGQSHDFFQRFTSAAAGSSNMQGSGPSNK